MVVLVLVVIVMAAPQTGVFRFIVGVIGVERSSFFAPRRMTILGAVYVFQCLTAGETSVPRFGNDGLSVRRFAYLCSYTVVVTSVS